MAIPPDAQTDRLRDALNRRLQQVASKIEGLFAAGAVPDRGVLLRIDALSASRQALEDSATTHDQRKFHESARAAESTDPSRAVGWHSAFIRMRDVYLLLRLEALHPGCTRAPISSPVRSSIRQFFSQPEPATGGFVLPELRSSPESMAREVGRARATLWSSLPHSRFKVFQQAFCDPMNFAVPLQQVPRERLDDCHLTACLVSPDLIPNKLLADLKLVDWPTPGISGASAHALKSSLTVTNGLKAMWESLCRLDPSNGHILVISRHSEEALSRYPDLAPIDPTVEGSLIYTREKVSGSTRAEYNAARKGIFEPRAVSVGVYASPYKMLRKTVQEELGYNSEAQELDALVTRWSALNREINEDWTRSTPVDARRIMKRSLETLVADTREALEGSTNTQKARVAELLDLIQADIDRSPVNPDVIIRNTTTILTRMVVAIEALRDRAREIPRKSSWNEADRRALRSCITANETRFNGLQARFREIDGALADSGRLFSGPALAPAERDAVIEAFIGRVGLKLTGFHQVDVRPFRAFAEKFMGFQEALRGALAAGDAQAARDSLVKFVTVWRLHQINAACETLRMNLIPGQGVSMSQLVETNDRLLNAVNEPGCIPAHRVESYAAEYEPIEEWVRSLSLRLTEFARLGISADAQAELHAGVREFLKASDIEGLIRRLPA